MGKASKDKRDAYYRLAKEQGWRARSAFKLLQLNEDFNLFEGVTRVVDLCAAPGSWSQVLSRVLIKREKIDPCLWAPDSVGAQIRRDEVSRDRCRVAIAGGGKGAGVRTGDGSGIGDGNNEEDKGTRDIKIVAIDLQPMTPLEGITTLAADITHPSTVPLLLQALDPDTYIPSTLTSTTTTTTTTTTTSSAAASNPVDLVLSDGAPDAIGLHDVDIYIQSQLLFSALNLALRVLKPGGTFVSKIFRGKDVDLTYARLKTFFEHVTVAKPRSSRASSLEAFVVCQGFKPGVEGGLAVEKPMGRNAKGWTVGLEEENVVVEQAKVQREESSEGPGVQLVKGEKREDGIIELHFPWSSEEKDDEDGIHRWIPPFKACGHPLSYDSDATYRLPKNRTTLDPVQPPTAPPYKRALEMRRAAGGAFGKTKAKR